MWTTALVTTQDEAKTHLLWLTRPRNQIACTTGIPGHTKQFWLVFVLELREYGQRTEFSLKEKKEIQNTHLWYLCLGEIEYAEFSEWKRCSQ